MYTNLPQEDLRLVASTLRELDAMVPRWATSLNFVPELRTKFEEKLSKDTPVSKEIVKIMDSYPNSGFGLTEWSGWFHGLEDRYGPEGFPLFDSWPESCEHQNEIDQQALRLAIAHVKVTYGDALGEFKLSPGDIADWPFALDARVEISRGAVSWYPYNKAVEIDDSLPPQC